MKHLSRALVLITLCIMESAALAAEATSNRVQLENELAFGSEEVAPLSGWRAGGANVQLTEEHVKDGRYAARVSHSSPAFSGVMKSIEPISPEPITMNTCRSGQHLQHVVHEPREIVDGRDGGLVLDNGGVLKVGRCSLFKSQDLDPGRQFRGGMQSRSARPC